ncbi:hypothetical protein [uncultured Xylophilus sp.]|uniref:hypothetical protein n=1 Tax=uncultured Xylophilus sp. TaxID=296832 RepID=UPI0025E4806B|nr:hypothetical protein [uncultured Xylophilus sp.]
MNKQPSARVRHYTEAAQSAATRRSYAQDMKHYLQHGGKIPATPLMVAEYLAAFGGTLSAATLAHRIVAINRAHADGGFDSPTKSVLDSLTRPPARVF